MTIEDISEERAKDILCVYARRAGWHDVTVRNNSLMLVSERFSDDMLYGLNAYPPNYSTVMYTRVNGAILDVRSTSHFFFKSCLKKIMELVQTGTKMTCIRSSGDLAVFIPAKTSLEEILIEYGMNKNI